MPRSVLHVLGTPHLEGAAVARIVATLAEHLDPERYRLAAWFLQGPGPLEQRLRAAGVATRALRWDRGARDPWGAWEFWRQVRALAPAVVHLHFGGRAVRWLARTATGAKVVVHLHSRVLERRGLELATFSARGADAVVAASRAVAACVVDGPARVIYAGVAVPPGALAARNAGTATEVVLGTAGRLVPLKGLDTLLEAVAALRAEAPPVRLELAGAGPERDRLEQRAARLGLGDRVSFLGWVDDLSVVLPRWDVFVVPSREEGLGIAALEAMAAGVPVVASSVGGLPEVVKDGTSGWLVPPGDVGALTSRLRGLLADPDLRARMGAAGMARARDRFSPVTMAAEVARLYDGLLAPGRQ